MPGIPGHRERVMTINLRMENISIFFGEFQALREVGIEVRDGEIHGLLGEN